MNPNKKNTVENTIAGRTDLTTNEEGGLAFKPTDRMKLYLSVAGWMVGEPTFYKKDASEVIELIRTVIREDPEFVIALAKYARNTLYLRTAPQVMLVECSLIEEGKAYVREAVPYIVRRPDEMTTCIAYLKSVIGDIGDQKEKGSMPNSLKKGLAGVFLRFSEYQLQKYNNLRKQVKLLDVMRLVHPKPRTEEQSEMFKRLRENKLKTPETWETIVSKEGSTTEAWTKASEVMPYMATLRNLRNLQQKGVDMTKPLERLVSPPLIAKSKQMPYRYFSAYREMAQEEGFGVTQIMSVLELAMETSIVNVPKLEGRSMIAADNSGSMTCTMSHRSDVMYKDVANLFLTMASRICSTAMTMLYGQKARVVNIPESNGMMATVKELNEIDVGHSTNGFLIMEYLLKNKISVDRIIVFSDMVMYDETHSYYGYGGPSHKSFAELLERYRREVNRNVYVYMFDLTGYGTLQVQENDPRVIFVGGFSDKILGFFGMYEEATTKKDWNWLLEAEYS